MNSIKSKVALPVAMALALHTLVSHQHCLAYESPYGVDFKYSKEELTAIDKNGPRNDFHLQSKIPYEDWYSRRTRKEYGVWGPPPRHYPAYPDFHRLKADFKRERVLMVACQLIGLPYQHHHIPDWDPPADWPWKRVAYGRNSKGMDCSDFSSWCYNYGLGIKLSTGIREQAAEQEINGPGDGGTIQIRRIEDDKGYEDLIQKLESGDLLFIRNNAGKIAHVIMWVGAAGRSPDGVPLIIDCTGPEHTDCNGNQIPIGVQLRPFKKDSWYYKSFDHANRIISKESPSGA